MVVNQQKNVLQGERLFVDRKAGKSHLETPAEGGQPAGRITATFYQSDESRRAKPAPRRRRPQMPRKASMFGSFKIGPQRAHGHRGRHARRARCQQEAVFSGNVKAQQGDFVMRTVEMTAFYTGQAGLGLPSGARRRQQESGAARRASRPSRRC